MPSKVEPNYFDDPPNLDEVLARAQIETKVRGEYDAAFKAISEGDRDKRVAALMISATLVLVVVLPLLALVLGFSWRVLMWTAGEGW